MTPLLKTMSCAAFLALAVGAAATTTAAADINTGGSTGAYHSTFCPQLARALTGNRDNYRCRTSAGSRENIERVYLNPRSIGYAQLDVIALETSEMDQSPYRILRANDVKECVFAVTRSRAIESYGDIAGYASQLRFILPPGGSGSAGTFQYLQEIDPDGLGLARNVVFANSTDDAIIRALNSTDAVTFFVQFPDPNNARFKLIKRLGGQLVPVIDRTILRQKIAGEKIYFAEETQVPNASWAKAGEKVVTACTPLVVFTGASWRIKDEAGRRTHRDLIASVSAIRTGTLLPRKGFFANILSRTRALTNKGRERFLRLSEEAREKARPLMERARKRALELGTRMKEKARPREPY